MAIIPNQKQEISYIQEGMYLEEVRNILNNVIQHINSLQPSTNDYNLLNNKPRINGVELNEQSQTSEFNISLENTDIEDSCIEIAEQTAQNKTVQIIQQELGEIIESKVPKNFDQLPQKEYDFNLNSKIAIYQNNTLYKTTLNDLIAYLKYQLNLNPCPYQNPANAN